jgi:hypothetical protein
MLSARSIHVERIKQGADSVTAWMILGEILDALVHVELRFLLTTHGLGIDEELEGDMAVFAEFTQRLVAI